MDKSVFNGIVGILGYAYLEEIKSGEKNPKEKIAKKLLECLDMSAEESSSLLLDNYQKQDKLDSVFELLIQVIKNMDKKKEYDEDSCKIVVESLEALRKQLEYAKTKYDVKQ